MDGNFILIAGSAGVECSNGKLDTAIQFVRCFTREVLNRGGGLVVLGSDEDSTNDERGQPRIFDWIVLREVERYASSTTELPRRYVRIVISDAARKHKLSPKNLETLKILEQRVAVELRYVEGEQFTGGEYREVLMDLADAMLTIGGGKGTYVTGSGMVSRGKPVLALDLQIGALSNDGEGALRLHKEMMGNPSRFFPSTHEDVKNQLGLVSLNAHINDVDTVAQVSAEIMGKELDALVVSARGTKSKQGLANPWLWIKDPSNFAFVAKVVAFMKELFS